MAIELLAPAKDLACGITAIDCGADAVYIGAPHFGAREAAGNSVADIASLVRHAHMQWARVYVTVNTLLTDEEIVQALRLIEQLYDSGVDGLIIQDVGLLECDLPPLPLIASTQMHNATPEKVAFLEQVGFQRAILARELTLEQIQQIRRHTQLELECFIHGSLCVGYSGQCYLSYALGGRSGNRGQCAQPCRKNYDLLDARDNVLVNHKHLLSVRDLDLSDHLVELLDAGITSFKIEGRLKDRNYVANVVSFYRARLDALIAERGLTRSSSGHSTIDFTPDLSKTFHRPSATHFLHGRNDKLGTIDTPKMIGELLGPVKSRGATGFLIETEATIVPGDGLCFFNAEGQLRGAPVNAARGQTVFPDKMDGIEAGTLIYRNRDHAFLTQLAASRPERHVAFTLTVREKPDGLLFQIEDEDGNLATFTHLCEKTPAEKPEEALANMQEQLQKCGGTAFVCTEVVIELPEPYFFPISVLNALRRRALEELTASREAHRPRSNGGPRKNTVPYPETILTYLGNALNCRAAAFYRRHGVVAIAPAAESGVDLHGRKIMTTRYCLKHQLDLCPKDHPTDPPAEPLFLRDEEGHRLELRFNCARCEMEIYLTGEPVRTTKRLTIKKAPVK